MQPTSNIVPRHIGIILDGNRRFAKRLVLKPFKGHEWGARKIEQLLTWCQELNIKEITLYAFSIENFDRPKKEFNFLMNLFQKEFDAFEKDKRVYDEQIKVQFVGRLNMFPDTLRERMESIMEKTKHHTGYTLNFAMAYGGRAEVIDATKKIAEEVKQGKLTVNEINDEIFKNKLYLQNDVDLLIRTSESRLSGFLPWQSVYSEVIFLPDKLWPEFEKEDFIACIDEYKRRKRRFGK